MRDVTELHHLMIAFQTTNNKYIYHALLNKSKKTVQRCKLIYFVNEQAIQPLIGWLFIGALIGLWRGQQEAQLLLRKSRSHSVVWNSRATC